MTYRIPENRRESSIFLSIICDYELEKKNSVGRQCPALMFLHIVHYSGMSSLFVYFRYDCMVRMRACVRACVGACDDRIQFIVHYKDDYGEELFRWCACSLVAARSLHACARAL